MLAFSSNAAAEFVDEFQGRALATDPEARNGWAFWTGDGEATMNFTQAGGHGIVTVDARRDVRNIWWALIRRSVSASIDEHELARPDRELRVEARVRASAAPRRVNLHFNHTRTTDFHAHLMEYDLPDTDWHAISFTTRNFDAAPGDEIFVQMALIDWGRELHQVEIDYIKVDVVDPAQAGPDLGMPLPYRPPNPPLESFAHAAPALEDALIDSAYPTVNFNTWTSMTDGDGRPLLAVSGSQLILLRWDLSAFRGRTPDGWGVLDLTTHQVQWAATDLEEFGELRVVEVLGGPDAWDRESVTYQGFFGAERASEVLNGQMMIDVPPARERGGRTLISVSPPVLQRLFSGRTRGLAIYGQGALTASFYSGQAGEDYAPTLHFNVK